MALVVDNQAASKVPNYPLRRDRGTQRSRLRKLAIGLAGGEANEIMFIITTYSRRGNYTNKKKNGADREEQESV